MPDALIIFGSCCYVLLYVVPYLITPTSGACSWRYSVPWTKWGKFAFLLLLMWFAAGVIAIGYATLTGYGPF